MHRLLTSPRPQWAAQSVPIPHPSWDRSSDLPASRPKDLSASEFWNRLGL